jgi:Protein of unknown function (DUF3551)
MQHSILIAATAAAVVLGTAIAAPGARAVEAAFPYCATPTWSEGLDCDYRSFEQCVAAIAGFNRTCVANPAFAGSQTQAPPVPHRRVR